MSMLHGKNINVYYGAIHAVKDISFHVDEGEVVTLIGANGAGKSTILKTISGLLHSHTGSITFLDQKIAGVPAHKIVSRGLAQVPEGRQVFLQMTVEENLEMGAYTRPGSEVAPGLETVYDSFPPEGAPPSGRRHALRRRTADAGHAGAPDVPPQTDDAGRALHGAGPHSGGADLRDHPDPPQGGHYHPRNRTPDGLRWRTAAMC